MYFRSILFTENQQKHLPISLKSLLTQVLPPQLAQAPPPSILPQKQPPAPVKPATKPRSFWSLSRQERQKRLHSNSIKCPHCALAYPSQTDLDDHIQAVHVAELRRLAAKASAERLARQRVKERATESELSDQPLPDPIPLAGKPGRPIAPNELVLCPVCHKKMPYLEYAAHFNDLHYHPPAVKSRLQSEADWQNAQNMYRIHWRMPGGKVAPVEMTILSVNRKGRHYTRGPKR